MRWTIRFAIIASIVLIILLGLLKNHLEDLWEQYNVTAYVQSSFKNTFRHGTLDYDIPIPDKVGDKVIVMAKMEKENTDWVAANLPEFVTFHLPSHQSSQAPKRNLLRDG